MREIIAPKQNQIKLMTHINFLDSGKTFTKQ